PARGIKMERNDHHFHGCGGFIISTNLLGLSRTSVVPRDSTNLHRTRATTTVSPGAARREASFALPRDAIRVQTNDDRILGLASRLWDSTEDHHRSRGKGRMPLHFAIDVREGRLNIPEALTEQWSMGSEDVELSLSRVLQARIAWVRGQLDGWVTAALLERDPSLVARLLMETPAAVLLARRSYAVVHAGTVVGKTGAVVIRG